MIESRRPMQSGLQKQARPLGGALLQMAVPNGCNQKTGSRTTQSHPTPMAHHSEMIRTLNHKSPGVRLLHLLSLVANSLLLLLRPHQSETSCL